MFRKLPGSFWNALRGIAHGISRETNIVIQMVIALIVIILSSAVGIPMSHLAIIVISCFLVIIMELANTSIEHLVNRISPEYDKEFGKVKDMMAGAVLLSVLMAVIAGILILWQPISVLFS